ncbi:MAG: hypothetical protein EZS28_023668, partial [Streblomastix strix]
KDIEIQRLSQNRTDQQQPPSRINSPLNVLPLYITFPSPHSTPLTSPQGYAQQPPGQFVDTNQFDISTQPNHPRRAPSPYGINITQDFITNQRPLSPQQPSTNNQRPLSPQQPLINQGQISPQQSASVQQRVITSPGPKQISVQGRPQTKVINPVLSPIQVGSPYSVVQNQNMIRAKSPILAVDQIKQQKQMDSQSTTRSTSSQYAQIQGQLTPLTLANQAQGGQVSPRHNAPQLNQMNVALQALIQYTEKK